MSTLTLWIYFWFVQGLNFQLGAVLLSIGVYAYIENGELMVIEYSMNDNNYLCISLGLQF